MQRSRIIRVAGLLALGAVALAIPAPDQPVPAAPERARSFVWNRDSVWHRLELEFVRTRGVGCTDTVGPARAIAQLDAMVDRLSQTRITPTAAVLDTLEAGFFSAAPAVAACGTFLPRYLATSTRMRAAIKAQSSGWDIRSEESRDRLYRALYGGRAAVEEVMLQQPGKVDPLALATRSDAAGTDAPPAAVSNGVTLHSGDILVSRGGFPTSALIARGNDYPGNFSHIALVHVDDSTHAISVIEAHIEAGVAVSTADKYLADKKLRVMVLRPRPDLPAMLRDPMLPHRAATAMLARARAEHIPYDFAMDYTNPARLFCSEVASSAYRTQGMELWMGISTISRTGLRRWLSGFGVEHFATQEPSDLEYDPQLYVVAEWHDAATLRNDHIDNAITDVMLDEADRGASLDFAWYTLPIARLAKAYSWARVQFGGAGPIPEGMSAASALRNRSYGTEHAARAAALRARAEQWKLEKGYPPTYWTLLELAAATRR